MSNSPLKSPSYLSLDQTSPWHISAVQAVALETMTIPSRLKVNVGSRGTLQDIEDSFNSTGKRRIAKLEMSVADPEVLAEKADERIAQAEKVGSMPSRQTSEGNDDGLTAFDIDTFTRDYRAASTRAKKKEHIFGRAESSRGEWNLCESGEGRDPHDGFDQGPAVQRYVTFRSTRRQRHLSVLRSGYH